MSVLARLPEWFLRTAAMREARAAEAGPDGRRARAHAQARLLAEVARRVAEPVEALPSGSRAAVQLALCRDATYWALAALEPNATDTSDLAALWSQAPAERLAQAAGGAEAADAMKKVLADGGPTRLLETTDDEADRALRFADGLLAELGAPRRRVERVAFQRWWRIGLVAVVLLALVFGIRALVLGTDFAADRPFRTSTSWSGCPCEGMFFHTVEENNPWVEFDLGAPKSIKRVDVANRPDCCADRAVPLIVEVSTDRTQWSEVARRTTEFSEWTAKFPARRARYVRLRVPKFTQFHLKSVAVR
jgi:hypothetical protein